MRRSLVVMAALAVSVSASALDGVVVAVIDGDTITVLDDSKVEHRVRLKGIDAPELRGQPFGAASKQQLADEVFNQRVVVDGTKNDRYGRLLGKVLINGRDVNLAQIQAGLAWHYKKYEGDQFAADRIAYSEAESAARSVKRGLWGDPDPIPPWEWRDKKIPPFQ